MRDTIFAGHDLVGHDYVTVTRRRFPAAHDARLLRYFTARGRLTRPERDLSQVGGTTAVRVFQSRSEHADQAILRVSPFTVQAVAAFGRPLDINRQQFANPWIRQTLRR